MTPKTYRKEIILRVVVVEIIIVLGLLVFWLGNHYSDKQNILSKGGTLNLTVVHEESYRQVAQVVNNTQPGVQSIARKIGEAKILFIGDMMFDRYIRRMNEKYGDNYSLTCIDSLLKNADFVVGNLEGPITENESVSKWSEIGSPNNYRFTFPTSTALLLAQHNISVVNIGNNHITNYGQSGVASTKKYLTSANVSYFGGMVGDSPVYRTNDDGLELSFVNYNQFGGDSIETVAQAIAKEKADNRLVIVYAHWGEEYSDSIFDIRRIAKIFSEKGADVIIGSHPHIVLPYEYIGSTLVYYSLGNFIFDQYFNSRVQKGLTVELDIINNSISAKEFSVTLGKDGRTCVSN